MLLLSRGVRRRLEYLRGNEKAAAPADEGRAKPLCEAKRRRGPSGGGRIDGKENFAFSISLLPVRSASRSLGNVRRFTQGRGRAPFGCAERRLRGEAAKLVRLASPNARRARAVCRLAAHYPKEKRGFCKKKQKPRLFSVSDLCLGSSYGAGICTSAAVDALIGVDFVDVARFNRFNRTSVSTSTTSDASVGNCISHWYVSSFLNCRQCCRYRNYSRQCIKNQVFLNIFKNFLLPH